MNLKSTRKKIYHLTQEAHREERAAQLLKSLFYPEAQMLAKKLIRSSSMKLELADELKVRARICNLSVYSVGVKRRTSKNGKFRIYDYWYASWRVEKKVRNVYLGSTEQMSHDEALAKARVLKAKDLSS
jgi:hypothetical protein